jgi:hypothetical protein
MVLPSNLGDGALGSLDSVHLAHARIDLREQVRHVQAAKAHGRRGTIVPTGVAGLRGLPYCSGTRHTVHLRL